MLPRVARTLAATARSAPRATCAARRFRVALIATAVVLVAYVVIAGAVMLIVNRNLVAAVDDRLSTLHQPQRHRLRPATGAGRELPQHRHRRTRSRC